MESLSRTRRDLRRRATRRRMLGALSVCGALAVAATAAIVVPAVTGTVAAYTDNAYLNLGAGGGKPIGTGVYDLVFRWRQTGDWSVGTELGVTSWIQADDDRGQELTLPAGACPLPLRPQSDASGSSACRIEIHVANRSPGIASTLQVRVDAAPGSDATAASALKYSVYSAFPASDNASDRRLEASVRSIGDVVPIRGADAFRPPLAPGPAVMGVPVVGGRLEFVFYLSDRGAALNAAVVGKPVSLQIKLHGRSVVSP
ncbi:hypothetical protein IT072_19680 [Leifsonia sp. ZF2019]|uniref:hypothetical protein n=1 Tax=Leifsonia sp. ZF2019 TaxID=2781978 RepID=UPI001CC05693|nr:hypothetical protein [Leifsonia sp. ZF2019]UAJ79379.1 hypothetical protein IT072_19680 [Leifsonia sp. ZF2019]